MNGNTTVITRAADMAVARGIVVLNAASNSGNNTSHNTLGAPADGDSVLAVGALTSSGIRASYSSVGPTTSNPPRFKPDVMAQGSSVWNASSSGTSAYGFNGSGTSYACPLAAGVAALVVHARPNATAMQVINALKSTSSNASSPNNLIGWGTLNAVAAIDAIPPTDVKEMKLQPGDFALEQNYPNPFNPTTTISFAVPTSSLVVLKVYNVLGQEVTTLVDGVESAGTHKVSFDARNLASGVYFCRMRAGEFAASKKLLLAK
jgi:subtilisin family serine protease